MFPKQIGKLLISLGNITSSNRAQRVVQEPSSATFLNILRPGPQVVQDILFNIQHQKITILNINT